MVIATFALLTLTGCSSINTPSADGITDSFPVITATGYSIVSIQPGKTHDQKVLQAMRDCRDPGEHLQTHVVCQVHAEEEIK